MGSMPLLYALYSRGAKINKPCKKNISKVRDYVTYLVSYIRPIAHNFKPILNWGGVMYCTPYANNNNDS